MSSRASTGRKSALAETRDAKEAMEGRSNGSGRRTGRRTVGRMKGGSEMDRRYDPEEGKEEEDQPDIEDLSDHDALCPFCDKAIRSDATAGGSCTLYGMIIVDMANAPSTRIRDGTIAHFCCETCRAIYGDEVNR